MKTTKISQRVYNSNQSWYFEELLMLDDKKIQIRIRKNAYDFQSWGIVELWDGTKWNKIHTCPGELLKCKRSYVEPNVTALDFAEDRKDLLHCAKVVLE